MSIPPHPPSSRYSHHSGWIIVPTLVVFPSTREADGLRFCQPDHFGVLRDKAVTARSGLAKLSVWLKPLRVLKRQLCGCPSTPSAVFFCLILGHSPGHWGWRIRVAGLRCPLSDVAWSGRWETIGVCLSLLGHPTRSARVRFINRSIYAVCMFTSNSGFDH